MKALLTLAILLSILALTLCGCVRTVYVPTVTVICVTNTVERVEVRTQLAEPRYEERMPYYSPTPLPGWWPTNLLNWGGSGIVLTNTIVGKNMLMIVTNIDWGTFSNAK